VSVAIDMLLGLVLVGFFRLLGLMWLGCLLGGIGMIAAGHGYPAVLLLWVAFAGVKDE